MTHVFITLAEDTFAAAYPLCPNHLAPIARGPSATDRAHDTLVVFERDGDKTSCLNHRNADRMREDASVRSGPAEPPKASKLEGRVRLQHAAIAVDKIVAAPQHRETFDEDGSIRTLREKIQSMLFGRTALSKKPELVARRELAKLRETDQLSPTWCSATPICSTF